jgi:regulator of protease activity HflC (stomatin/prohibitin superfamily)
MKKSTLRLFITSLAFIALGFLSTSCNKVPAGNVGIKFYLLGGKKGVDYEALKPGRYWIGINEELYIFPTQLQNYVWQGSEAQGSFAFQDKEGLKLSADIGITYRIQEEKVPHIFEKYKKGLDEITSVFLRNMIRDALVKRASKLNADYMYGEGRSELIESVQTDVINQVQDMGIIIEKLYWTGEFVLPRSIVDAIDMKIKAIQIAQQTENELRQTEAQAKKVEAQATGEANAILTKAKAQAEANRILAASITPSLIDYEKVKKWNGQNSQVVGSNGGVLLNLK